MNFSIVMPGGCNGACKFCFWKEQAASATYMKDAESIIKNLPDGLNLSITGGEPTMSIFFSSMLNLIKKYKSKFEKVILTTNGSYLHKWVDAMSGIVDHINVSRHHYDPAVREQIFGSEIAPDFYLKPVVERFNQIGIDVTLNAVLCGVINTKEDVLRFIDYAKGLGTSSICFRKDYGEDDGLTIGGVESLFENYKSIYTYECPVCRTKAQIINGMKIVWKSSSYEPSVDLKDVYELILQPTSKLTVDWAGEHEIRIYNGAIVNGNKLVVPVPQKKVNKLLPKPVIRTDSYSGCGNISTRRYSGCGRTEMSCNHTSFGCGH